MRILANFEDKFAKLFLVESKKLVAFSPIVDQVGQGNKGEIRLVKSVLLGDGEETGQRILEEQGTVRLAFCELAVF